MAIPTVIEEPVSMAPSPSAGVLFQMIVQNHELSESGHKRLRLDMRELEKEVDRIVARQGAFETIHNALNEKVTRFETTPLNVEKVSFSGRQLAVIISISLGIAAGIWQLHVGVAGLQTSIQNASKLQDERNETQKQAMDQLRAAIEMRRVEIQNLANYIQQNVTQRPGARP